MTITTLKGNPITIGGVFPKPGDYATEFTLTKNDLSDVTLDDFDQKFLVLNIFPSLDTEICSLSIKHFNTSAADLPDCGIICISKDLPFAFGRFCEANNIKTVTTLSAFRSPDFAENYGVNITSGPIRGLLSRAVIVLNDARQVIYSELVPEIAQEPNYDKCLSVIANYGDTLP